MARRRTSRAKKRAKQQGKSGLTLDTVTLMAYMFFVLIFAIALWLSQQASYSQIRLQQTTASDAVSRSVTYQLSRAANSYAYALESMARDPALLQLITNADDAALSQRAQELYKAFPYSIALRIFRVGTQRLDESTFPQVGYACLDLMNAVTRGNNKPPIEVHVPKTKQQHIEIVRPIMNGARAVGYIQLALDVKAFTIWLNEVVGKNYIELIQQSGDHSIHLGKAGNEELRSSEPHYYDVGGTRWKVAVWSPASSPILPITIEALIIFFLAVSLLGVVVFMLKRSVSHAIQSDATSLIRITADTLLGKKQHGYQLNMPEFIAASRTIDQLRSDAPAERERDDDPNALSVGSAGSDDLSSIRNVFGNSGGVSVEEFMDNDVTSSISERASQAATPKSKATFESREISVTDAAMTTAAAMAQSSGMGISQSAPALPPPEIFKAYDIRGIVGMSLTPQHAELIGRAIGSEAIERGLTSMAFARDGRLSGPELGKAFVTGVQSTGIDVIDVGMVPTPVLYYAATEQTGGTGVMLTGSHNPPNYNGFKMMLGGETLSGEQIQQLRRRIETQQFDSGAGKYVNQGVGKAYNQNVS